MGDKRHSSTEESLGNALNGICQSAPERELLSVNPAVVWRLGFELHSTAS